MERRTFADYRHQRRVLAALTKSRLSAHGPLEIVNGHYQTPLGRFRSLRLTAGPSVGTPAFSQKMRTMGTWNRPRDTRPHQQGKSCLHPTARDPSSRAYDTHRTVPLSVHAAGSWETAQKKPGSVETRHIPPMSSAHRDSCGSSCSVLENVCRKSVPAKRHREGFSNASFGNLDDRMGRVDERPGVPRESVPLRSASLRPSKYGVVTRGAHRNVQVTREPVNIDRRQQRVTRPRRTSGRRLVVCSIISSSTSAFPIIHLKNCSFGFSECVMRRMTQECPESWRAQPSTPLAKGALK